MKTTWHHIMALTLVLTGLASPLSAYTYRQVGVFSNFVVHDGRVYFTQSDGSLTVLDLETGGVITRTEDLRYARSLQLTDAGILISSSRGTTLLAPSTLDVIWQAERRHMSWIAEERLILCDGNGLVECLRLETGNTLWTYNLPGALDIVVENEKVLVFRSAVFDGPDRVPAVVLLDLETGKEIFHKTTPLGVHYIHAYFDGERIYLPMGTYKGEHTPNVTRYDQGRPSARFEKLLIWDLNGNEIDSVEAPESLRNERLRFYREPFALGGKFFTGGRVYAGPEAVPPSSPGLGLIVPASSPGDAETAFTRFEVAGGSLTMRPAAIFRERPDQAGEQLITITLDSAHGNWTGRLPYLPSPGTIYAVGSTEDRILLGSNLGHVECIETPSGKSIWMYVFPTIRHTTSFSSRGMPPYLATAAAIYKRENGNPVPESGMVLDGSVEPSHPKIICDPSPANPFRKLPRYLAIAWSGAAAPLIFVGLIALARWKRRWHSRVLAGLSLVLIVPAVACLWSYGRVSLGSSIGLRVAILVLLLTALAYSVISLREKQWVSGAVFLFFSVAIAVCLFPVFVHL